MNTTERILNGESVREVLTSEVSEAITGKVSTAILSADIAQDYQNEADGDFDKAIKMANSAMRKLKGSDNAQRRKSHKEAIAMLRSRQMTAAKTAAL